ncbi:MAG: hypothetical protein QNJ20_03595 [Paracoccaceae bacterium]|nr:hypothetical protein [Paracoccaceae bacterium]
MKVVFKHHRETTNLGDRWCSPFDHLPDIRQAWEAEALDLGAATPECDVVIYGGGKIMGGLAATFGPGDLRATHRIAWGVSTVQNNRFSLKYWRAYRRLSLVGTRDWGDNRFDFAPCSSCMAPHFNAPSEPEHDVVAYLHHWRSDKMKMTVPDGIPVLDNKHSSFKEAIEHIASGATVVSNSYHGTYWGLLLGRKVLCVPFSKKFSAYRVQPAYSTADRWTSELSSARASDEMLSLCREATASFAKKVTELIERTS